MNRPIIEIWIPLEEIRQEYRVTDNVIDVRQLRLRVQILTLPEGIQVSAETVVHAGIGHPVRPVPFTVFLRADLKDGDGSFQELIREKMPLGFGTVLLDPPT